MAKFDPIATLEIAAIVAAGVAAYLVVTKIAKTGAAVGDAIASVATDAKAAAVNTVTKTLNPASSENMVNKGVTAVVGQNAMSDFGDWLGSVFDPAGYSQYQANLKKIGSVNGGASNVKEQANAVTPKKKFSIAPLGMPEYHDAVYNAPLTFEDVPTAF